MSSLLEDELVIYDAAGSSPAVTITSTRGGTNPYLSKLAEGDGTSFDPKELSTITGSYTVHIADWDVGSMKRILTQYLEDADGKQQLGYRKARIRRRIDGGSYRVLIQGYLTRLSLISFAEWECEVSDALRAGILNRLFSPASDTSMTDFIDAWSVRGCVVGGPIMTDTGNGTFAVKVQDRGGWQCRVVAEANGIYRLAPLTTYGPPNWNTIRNGTIPREMADAINNAVSTLQVTQNNGARSPWTTIADAQSNYWYWPGLVVLVDGVPWKPITNSFDAVADADGNVRPAELVGPTGGAFESGGGPGIRVIDDNSRTLTNGALVKVRIITILPSEVSPIYIEGNPVDVITTLLDAASPAIPYNAAAFTAFKADSSIGSDASISFRITSATDLADLLREVRIYGICLRTNDDGELVPFQGRIIPDTVPTKTVTDECIVDGSTKIFEYDATSGISTVTVRQQLFANVAGTPNGRDVTDAIQSSPQQFTFVNADALAHTDFTMETNGMLSASAAKPAVFRALSTNLAQGAINRFGQGTITAETTLLRGADLGGGNTSEDVVLGEELLIDLAALPNANYRLGDNNAIGARAMQVTQITEVPEGFHITLVDSGPNASPVVTVPTVTVAASSDLPRTVATFTITNAGTLNASNYGVEVQWGFGSSPSASAYAPIMSFASGAVPTGAVRLPPVVAGTEVNVRARSTAKDARPSSYGSSDSDVLSSIDDPTALSVTPDGSDASLALLEWTPGANAGGDLADVYLRLDGETFDAATRIATLAGGSTQYTITDLTASEDYIASVQHRDPITGDTSDAVDESFTAGASTVTLDPPESPTAFAFTRGSFPISYGIALVATEIPGTVEAAVAVETSPGAGTFGSFTTLGSPVPSVSGDWTTVSGNAPNDGKLRRLKARHIGNGQTSSSYTSTVDVNPSVLTSLPVFPGLTGPDLVVTGIAYVAGNAQISFTSSDAVEYNINNGAFSSAGSSPLVIAQTAAQQDVVLRATRNGRTVSLPIAVAATGGGGAPDFGTATASGVTLVNDANNTLRVTWSYDGSLSDKFHVYIDEGSGYSDVGPTTAGVTSFDWDSSIDYTSGAGGSPSVTVHAYVTPTDGTNDGTDSNVVSNTINVV